MDTSLWILYQSWYFSVIVTYNDTNDKTAVSEFISYHLQNCIGLHTFRNPLKVLLVTIYFYLFSPIIPSIKPLTCLWINNRTNKPLGYPTDDECIPTRGFMSTSIWFFLPPHIICNYEFYLVLFLSWYDIAHNCTCDWLLCASVAFISIRRASSFTNYLAICSAMPTCASILWVFQNPVELYLSYPIALWIVSHPKKCIIFLSRPGHPNLPNLG